MESSRTTLGTNQIIQDINRMECQIRQNDRVIQQLLKTQSRPYSIKYPKTPIDEICQLKNHLMSQIV